MLFTTFSLFSISFNSPIQRSQRIENPKIQNRTEKFWKRQKSEDKSMKKHILIFTLFFIAGVSLVFADKSRFYENGKVLDTMYVDSSEGLRVRDKHSLKSNRLCGLPHRLPVVALHQEIQRLNWVYHQPHQARGCDEQYRACLFAQREEEDGEEDY